jgi:hypothetical protein
MGFITSVIAALTERFPNRKVSWTWYFNWTGARVNTYAFFSSDEVKGLDAELCAMLDLGRAKAGVPFDITCGLRTVEKNASLANSVNDSAHLTGHAVDLACSESSQRFAMIKGLLAAGFTRIGIYSAHIHADNDSTKPQNVIWYVEGA